MGSQVKTREQNFKYFKKMRILILIFTNVLLAIVVGILIFLLLDGKALNTTWIITVIIVVVLLITVLLIYLKGKMTVIDMNYKYLKMLKEKKGLKPIGSKIFTKAWLNHLKEIGFTLEEDSENYQIYYHHNTKKSDLFPFPQTFISVIVFKNDSINFYDKEIDQKLSIISSRQKGRVRRHIILGFFKFENQNDEIVNKLDQIINFKDGQNVIIQVPVGYFYKDDKIYFLEPLTKYPHKFYFYTCKLVKQITKVVEL